MQIDSPWSDLNNDPAEDLRVIHRKRGVMPRREKRLKLGDGTVLTAAHLACPACQSPAHRPCTAPNDNSRHSVPWFHHAREAHLYTIAESAHLEVEE